MKTLSLITALSAALLLTACGSSATTAESADIKARQQLMQDWRGASDILKGMSENPANFNADVLKEQANFLAGSTAQAWGLFNENAKGGDAKDEVWTDAAGFQAKQAEFDAAVTALQTASQTATQLSDVEPLMGKVGESCGSCHKVYKK